MGHKFTEERILIHGMINVLEHVKLESEIKSEYEDEKIMSNLYLVSLSKPLRSVANVKDNQKEYMKYIELNDWLKTICEPCGKVPVIDMDNVKNLVDKDRKSCDALWYSYSGTRKSILAEFKNSPKSKVMELIRLDVKESESIQGKLASMVRMIQEDLLFGGKYDNEELVKHTHFLLVYNGKNDVPVSNVRDYLPRKTEVKRDGKKKQNRAARNVVSSRKETDNILDRFAEYVEKSGLCDCTRDEFPGSALPRLSKSKAGKKTRKFSLFSVSDFAEIVMDGFFESWDWGEYLL